MNPRHVQGNSLRATYRWQFSKDFTFEQAAELAEYLAELGISHVYASPYLHSTPGSSHGYDVLDHTRVNTELGGAAGFVHFTEALRTAGIGQLLDFVPNHMGISSAENRWWWDVLQNGPASRYAHYFDIDWPSSHEEAHNKLVLPVLEDHYGKVLHAGLFHLEREGGALLLHYGTQRFPISPRSSAHLVQQAATECQHEELAFIADSLAQLPEASETERLAMERRHRNSQVLMKLLERLVIQEPSVQQALDAVITRTNYDPAALDALLLRQNYRLVFWRNASDEIDYRRFFDVNQLASLRTEDDEVFDAIHVRVLEWLKNGTLVGLRIDHIDGLREPHRYLARLREQAPQAWLLVEKILAEDEQLPRTWPVDGTTGYEFMNGVLRVLMHPAGEDPLRAQYLEFTGNGEPWNECLHRCKGRILKQLFSSDVQRLVALLREICQKRARFRDFTQRELTWVISEVLIQLDVYRTYVRPQEEAVSSEDEQRIQAATERARAARAELDEELVHLVRDILLLKTRGDLESDFVARFQQLSGPAMAKGAEDTAFYNFLPFPALNEVGGHPDQFSIAWENLVRTWQQVQATWPATLLATSTHDSKRAEDVRARLAVLSEIPTEWWAAVKSWSELNSRPTPTPLPDRNTEYLVYSTLVGAWPIERDRLWQYMLKAIREAKNLTSWLQPVAEYESLIEQFVDHILGNQPFIEQLMAFVDRIREPGHVNSLTQTLWKLTAPGIPDIYQGQELWDLSLVDPDNRRPVDYALRRQLLPELRDLRAEQIMDRIDDGLPKLHLIVQALRLRRELPTAFSSDAALAPLPAEGEFAHHVLAFRRGEQLISVGQRWMLSRQGSWADTRLGLPPGEWLNVLTGETWSEQVAVNDLLHRFPVALLHVAPSRQLDPGPH